MVKINLAELIIPIKEVQKSKEKKPKIVGVKLGSDVKSFKGYSSFNNDNFYYYYKLDKGVITKYQHDLVLSAFFDSLVEYLLKGNKVTTPIGKFFIKKVFNGVGKKLSFAAMKKHEFETGERKLIYRENPYYYSFHCNFNHKIDGSQNYIFTAAVNIYKKLHHLKVYLDKCIS